MTYPVPGIASRGPLLSALGRPPVAAAVLLYGETTDLNDVDGPTDARTTATGLQTGTVRSH